MLELATNLIWYNAEMKVEHDPLLHLSNFFSVIVATYSEQA
jgi:hypothetical protein